MVASPFFVLGVAINRCSWSSSGPQQSQLIDIIPCVARSQPAACVKREPEMPHCSNRARLEPRNRIR